MHRAGDFYRAECRDFLRRRHRPADRRIRMPRLGSAPAWQTDAFTEIFTSSANKMYARVYERARRAGDAPESTPRRKSKYILRGDAGALLGPGDRKHVVHRSPNYRGENAATSKCNVYRVALERPDAKRSAPRADNWTRAIQCAKATFARTFSRVRLTKRYK